MSGDAYDGFGDVINQNAGIFGADQPGLEPALATHDSVKTTPTPSCVMVSMFCPRCGMQKDIGIEYGELMAIQGGVPPQLAYQGRPGFISTETDWFPSKVHPGHWTPDVTCQCGGKVTPHLSPNEAGAFVQQAVRAGWLNPQAAQMATAVVQQTAMAMRQRQGR